MEKSRAQVLESAGDLLPELSERSYAGSDCRTGPDNERIYGGAPGLTLIVRDDSATSYSEKNQNIRRTPLATPFELRSAFMRLRAFALGATASRASLIEATVAADMTLILLSATEADAGKSRTFAANGVSGPGTSLLIAPPGAQYRLVTETDLTAYQLIYRGSLVERGWPVSSSELSVAPAGHAEWARIRNIISDIFSITLIDPAFFESENACRGVEENIEMLLDEAVRSSSGPINLGRGTLSNFRIANKADTFIKANLGRPVYNDEICMELGVSPRVLHDAIVSVMKMPLQRYLKLQRLWGARYALMSAPPETLVKTIALDYGFWHLPRFSAEYTDFFGESPSETKRRSRGSPRLERAPA